MILIPLLYVLGCSSEESYVMESASIVELMKDVTDEFSEVTMVTTSYGHDLLLVSDGSNLYRLDEIVYDDNQYKIKPLSSYVQFAEGLGGIFYFGGSESLEFEISDEEISSHQLSSNELYVNVYNQDGDSIIVSFFEL